MTTIQDIPPEWFRYHFIPKLDSEEYKTFRDACLTWRGILSSEEDYLKCHEDMDPLTALLKRMYKVFKYNYLRMNLTNDEKFTLVESILLLSSNMRRDPEYYHEMCWKLYTVEDKSYELAEGEFLISEIFGLLADKEDLRVPVKWRKTITSSFLVSLFYEQRWFTYWMIHMKENIDYLEAILERTDDNIQEEGFRRIPYKCLTINKLLTPSTKGLAHTLKLSL